MDLCVHEELHSFYRAKSKKSNNADTTPNPFFLPGVPALWGLLGTRCGRRCIPQEAQLWCSECSFRLVIKCSLSPVPSDMIGILYETWQWLATLEIGAPPLELWFSFVLLNPPWIGKETQKGPVFDGTDISNEGISPDHRQGKDGKIRKIIRVSNIVENQSSDIKVCFSHYHCGICIWKCLYV